MGHEHVQAVMESILVDIEGIVQGVGFRPFLYNLAITHGLKGWVMNRGNAGVRLRLEGEKNSIDRFLSEIDKKKPADAERMTSVRDYVEKYGYRWADPKESDFPLVIEMVAPPVPEEIKGPFPEDAPWRTAEKSPAKNPARSFWPW